MPLETFTDLASLNPAWPDGAVDTRSEGDNHLRGIKTTLAALIAANGIEVLSDFPAMAGNGGRVVRVKATVDGFEYYNLDAAEIKTLYESNTNTNVFTDAHQTKLDGIETGATADQTAAEIKTAYESNADTNEFSDAEQTKLAGIETAADVTDATNVAAAGAVMDGDFSTNGVAVRTGAGAYTNRTITGTGSEISVSNGDGVSGNPTLSLPATLAFASKTITDGDFTPNVLQVKSYTVAGAPGSHTAGEIIYVSDETGGAVIAFSDGTNWRRVTDRAVIA